MTANDHLLPREWPHERLKHLWETGVQTAEGATQPWLQALLYQLCRALDVRRAVELGCWKGITSGWLACAIAHNGGGRLTVVDVNATRLTETLTRVATLDLSGVTLDSAQEGSLDYLARLPADTQFVFLDDDKAQVAPKLARIKERAPGCYVALHDAEMPNVTADLRAVGGIILDIPPGDGSGSLGLVRL